MTVLDNLNVGLYEEDHLNVAYALVYEEDMTVLDLLNVYKEPSPGIPHCSVQTALMMAFRTSS